MEDLIYMTDHQDFPNIEEVVMSPVQFFNPHTNRTLAVLGGSIIIGQCNMNHARR